MILLKEIFEKSNLKRKQNQKTTKKCVQNFSVGKDLKTIGLQILEYNVFGGVFRFYICTTKP